MNSIDQDLHPIWRLLERDDTPEAEILTRIKKVFNSTFMTRHRNQSNALVKKVANSRHINILKYLIEGGFYNVDKNRNDETIFHIATKSGNLNFVKYLMENVTGTDINQKDNKGRLPLYYAVSSGFMDIAELIVKEFRIKNGFTPLHWAAENNLLDLVKFLTIREGTVAKCMDRFRNTPLHYAALSGSLDVVKYFMEEKSIDPMLRNINGETAFSLADKNGHRDVIDFFTQKLQLHKMMDNVNFQNAPHNPVSQNFIGMVIDVIDIAVGVTSILQDVFGIFPDKQSEEFEKVFNALGRNYDAIQEVGKKVDRNLVAMKLVYDLISNTLSAVEETRQEMRQGFKVVLESLNELKVGDKVSSLTTFIDDFAKNVRIVKDLSSSVKVTELQREGGILDKLQKAVAADGNLHGNLDHILNQRLAIPKDKTDNAAFAAFHILYYGVQTYVSVMFFVLEQYSYLADFYYQKGDVTKCNGFFDLLQINFNSFKESLLSSNNKKQLIDRTIDVLTEIQGMSFVRNNREDVFNVIQKRLDSLALITQTINETKLPLVADQPGVILRKPDFVKSQVKTPVGAWKTGALVSYAIQYKDNSTYSKVGEWSDAFTVYDKANPFLKLPVDPQRRTRLIFRKFDNEQPQLVAAIEDKYETSFRDIDRDLYESCLSSNEEIGKHDFQILLQNGADFTQTFDNGRNALHAAAQRGNLEIASEFLLKNNKLDVNSRDNAGCTPIYIAAEAGYEDFVGLMIRKKADINIRTNSEKLTPLHISAYKGDVSTVKVLLESTDTDLNVSDAVGFTPLHNAVFGGTYVTNCLSENNKTDINARSNEGLTALHLAAINNFEDIVEVLANNERLDVNAETVGNLTALHFAASMGSEKVVKLILNLKNINVNSKSADGWTALHFATFLKKENTALELLKYKNIEVSPRGKNDITPLHISALTEQKNVVVNLLQLNASLEEKTKDGLTALHLSVMNNKLDIVTLLLSKGADIKARTSNGSTSLHLAASQNLKEMVLLLIKKHADLNIKNNNGRAPIHEAVFYGKIEMVRLLVESDSKQINLRTEDSASVLHIAAEKGYLDIVKYLINEKGMDKNIQDDNQYVPLHYAAKYGQIDIIKYLVNTKNVDCNIKGKDDKNSLHFAAEGGELVVVRFLVDEKRVDVQSKTQQGKCSLHFAAEKGKTDVLKYLIDEKRLDMNLRLWDGNYPMHLASKNGFLSTLKYFIDERGADVNLSGNQSKTVLHFAAENAHMDIVKYLLEEKNVNIEVAAFNQKTSLHFATEKGAMTLVKYLVERKANVNAQMDMTVMVSAGYCKLLKKYCGETPLHLAAGKGYFEIVKYLVDHKSIVNIKAFKYKSKAADIDYTPADLGALRGYLDIVKYLLQFENAQTEKQNKSNILHMAAFGGNLDIVKFIVGKRRLDITKEEQKDAVRTAAINGHLNVIRYLIDEENFAFSNEILPSTVGFLEVLRYFIEEKNVDVNIKDSVGRTALNAAAFRPIFNVVKYLLSFKNIDINSRDRDGYTPINRAAYGDFWEVLKLLAENKADVNIKQYIESPAGGLNGDGCSPLHFAVYNNNLDMVKYLIEKGADVNSRAAKNYTPLHANQNSYPGLNVVKCLVEHGADVNSKADYGYTPLFNACDGGADLDVVKYLIGKGAEINARISKDSPWYAGLTPVSALSIRDDVKNYLLQIGAKRFSPAKEGHNTKLEKLGKSSYEAKQRFLASDAETEVNGRGVSDWLSSFSSFTKKFQQPVIEQQHFVPTFPIPSLGDIDRNSTLLLLDTVIRKITGQAYPSAVEQMSVAMIHASALKITEKFEKMFQEMTELCELSPLEDVDSFGIYQSVENYMRNREWSNITDFLSSVATKVCPGLEADTLNIMESKIHDMLIDEGAFEF